MNRFVARALLFAGLQVAIFAVLFFQARKAPDPYVGMLVDKHEQAAAESGPRLLLVGGSSLAFSTWSEELARTLPYRPANLGVHAGFGLDFILQDAVNEVRRDDLVALVIEYSLFDGENPTVEMWEGVLCRPHVLAHMDWPPVLDAAFQFVGHVSRRGRRALLGSHSFRDEGLYSRVSFNDYGDVFAHRDLPPDHPPFSWDVAETMRKDGNRVYRRNLARIARFTARCEQRGARVVALFPCIPEKLFERDIAGIDRTIEGLRGILGSRVLGRIEDIPRPEEEFYDSSYHMTGPGGKRHTERMIERIAAFEAASRGEVASSIDSRQ